VPLVRLTTEIRAPLERCFDLARSIDFHQKAAGNSEEKAISGVTSGLIALDQTVTWEARHFGIRQQLEMRVVEFEPPYYFRDVIVKGVFRAFDHRHRFEHRDGTTAMTDELYFRAPFGLLGMLADAAFLTHYMRRFLLERNRLLKQAAESAQWRNYL